MIRAVRHPASAWVKPAVDGALSEVIIAERNARLGFITSIPTFPFPSLLCADDRPLAATRAEELPAAPPIAIHDLSPVCQQNNSNRSQK